MSLTIAHFDLANQKMSKIVHLCMLRIDIIFAAVSDGQILPTNLIFFVLWPSQRRNKKERVGVESKMIHIGSVFGKIQKRILTWYCVAIEAAMSNLERTEKESHTAEWDLLSSCCLVGALLLVQKLSFFIWKYCESPIFSTKIHFAKVFIFLT